MSRKGLKRVLTLVSIICIPLVVLIAFVHSSAAFEIQMAAGVNDKARLDDVFVVDPDLSVVKQIQPEHTVIVGSAVTYTIDISTTGGDFTGVVMTDTLPGGTLLQMAAPSQGTCDGTSIIVCDLGMLTAGNQASVTLIVTTTASGFLDNVATVAANEAETDQQNNTYTLTHRVSPPWPQPGMYGTTVEGSLIFIDLESGAGTLVSSSPNVFFTELEHDNNTGRTFVYVRNYFAVAEIDIRDGTPITVTSFDVVFNGLEYVGDIAYGTSITEAQGASQLQTVDLAAGTSSVIGYTGVGPVSGLAYDLASDTMYGVLGGQLTMTNFITIDLNTGLATSIGSTGVVLGGLQFGPDGTLYGVSGGALGPSSLYEINTTTGAATLIGPTGFGRMSGLTLVDNFKTYLPAILRSP